MSVSVDMNGVSDTRATSTTTVGPLGGAMTEDLAKASCEEVLVVEQVASSPLIIKIMDPESLSVLHRCDVPSLPSRQSEEIAR